jgi:UPF0716 protein FxsA
VVRLVTSATVALKIKRGRLPRIGIMFTALRNRLPLGLLAFLAWVAIEIVAFQIVASWTGGAVAAFLFIAKPVVGFMIVGRKIGRVLKASGGFIRMELDDAGAGDAMLAALGGFLLIIPGFAAGVAGLALLSQPVRQALARRFGRKRQGPKNFDLESGDWRETSVRAPRKLRAPRGGE